MNAKLFIGDSTHRAVEIDPRQKRDSSRIRRERDQKSLQACASPAKREASEIKKRDWLRVARAGRLTNHARGIGFRLRIVESADRVAKVPD
jgi:hypothetical protein